MRAATTSSRAFSRRPALPVRPGSYLCSIGAVLNAPSRHQAQFLRQRRPLGHVRGKEPPTLSLATLMIVKSASACVSQPEWLDLRHTFAHRWSVLPTAKTRVAVMRRSQSAPASSATCWWRPCPSQWPRKRQLRRCHQVGHTPDSHDQPSIAQLSRRLLSASTIGCTSAMFRTHDTG